ncbi:MAG: flavodoxin domain-containing protein [Anaerolineae bacterium]
MPQKVLVAYGTKYGATAEIAGRIGNILQKAGWAVDVLPAGKASDISLYNAMVLGSAVYAGSWRKDAAQLLTKHEKALSERPVWLFSSGPTGSGDPVTLLNGWSLPDALRPVAERIHVRDIAVFHGALDMQKLNFAERFLIRGIKAPAGDFRDWNAITAWAEGIAKALQSL